METLLYVSVPLRGLGQRKVFIGGVISSLNFLFQSPCGDQVSGKYIGNHSTHPDEEEVSVPLRGLGQRKAKRSSFSDAGTRVSVPLRGLGQRKEEMGFSQKFQEFVSVPLRGLGQRKGDGSFFRSKEWNGFQSPCGDQVSGKYSLQRLHSEGGKCFSPLAGIRLAESPPSETQSRSVFQRRFWQT